MWSHDEDIENGSGVVSLNYYYFFGPGYFKKKSPKRRKGPILGVHVIQIQIIVIFKTIPEL